LLKCIITVLFALGVIFATEPKLQYQLDFKAQNVSSALINGKDRLIYDMFVPEFRRKHGYARFDSAVKAWLDGRRINNVRTKVVDITGLGGHVSTYVYFQGDKDYDYFYQNWLYTDSGWQLVWISYILDQSFDYGTGDTQALGEIVKTGLRFLVSKKGLSWIGAKRVNLPETLVVVEQNRVSDSFWSWGGHFFVGQTKDDFKKSPLPAQVSFYCEVAMVRKFGTIALVSLDLKPWSSAGKMVLPRPRGTEIYLKRSKEGWMLHSLGKRW